MYFTVIEKCVQRGKLNEIDHLLANINVKDEAIVVMTGVIRITARYKNILDNWDSAFKRISAEVRLQRGDLEADRILLGLVP